MKLLKIPALIFLNLAATLLTISCVADPGLTKKRGIVNDFSITKTGVGCGSGYLILSQNNQCTTGCGTGLHVATSAELATAKTTTDTSLLAKINGSAGLCIDDVIVNTRPTNQIDIKSDFCSCINGKSDLISDCAATCSAKATSSTPTLYLNTIMGTDIALNTKLVNLSGWCTAQLEGDSSSPQCQLSATDGTNIINNIPITSITGNSLVANIQNLALDRTYIVKIVELKSGSQSKEFQLRRKTQPTDDTSQLGALKITPINQYTCMSYGGTIDGATGKISRTSYARVFYYFAANETPPPIPPAGGNNQSTVVCHDEQLHPGNDNAEYPRLELIPQLTAMWDKSDPRFVNSDNTMLQINKTIITRLFSEFGVQSNTMDIFKLINYPNRPSTATTSTANIPLGYMMVPFTDKNNKTFCPTQTDFNAVDQPLFNVLKDYMDDTEGLYLAEKEAETILDGSTYKTIYGTMFVTQTILKNYGFSIENGLKIRANPTSMNTKTIYYYWPVDVSMDPLIQGGRKLFTVRTPSTLNGNVPTGQATNTATTDKRIGCVPKSAI
ncbi:MAG: hypothetical protein Q7U04_10285 [Bacteriovorax sp.]|nr:hypothetical protein [Bacteriovorax sp.]